jgi:hypothetical protein
MNLRMSAVRVGADDARIDREALATDEAFCDASLNNGLEQLAERIAVAEPALPCG